MKISRFPPVIVFARDETLGLLQGVAEQDGVLRVEVGDETPPGDGGHCLEHTRWGQKTRRLGCLQILQSACQVAVTK